MYFSCTEFSFAAAWTQSKNSGQLILSLNNYNSTNSFDENGNPYTSRFSKYEINPFIEYGVTKDITIGANPNLQYWHVGTNSGNFNGQLFESEFFLRKKLFDNGKTVFSLQPLVKMPCIPLTGSEKLISCEEYEMEIRALAGYSFATEKKTFRQ